MYRICSRRQPKNGNLPAWGFGEARHQKEILLLNTELMNIKMGTVSEDIYFNIYFERHCDLK
jgi:hypothetical protein